jgi:hypothetical protein
VRKAKVCSRCGISLAPTNDGAESKTPYGVCPDCEGHFERQKKGKALESFLDTVGFPAMMVDKDLRVIAYNKSCLLELCGLQAKPTGLLPGEFLECHNASLPERCGASPACLDCAIRQTAIGTMRTGESQNYVPAIIAGEDEGRRVRREYIISTDKVGDLVRITVEKLVTVLEPPSEKN